MELTSHFFGCTPSFAHGSNSTLVGGSSLSGRYSLLTFPFTHEHAIPAATSTGALPQSASAAFAASRVAISRHAQFPGPIQHGLGGYRLRE